MDLVIVLELKLDGSPRAGGIVRLPYGRGLVSGLGVQTAANEGRAAEVCRSLQQRHPQLISPTLKRSRRLSLSASRCLQRRSSQWRCARLGRFEGVWMLSVSRPSLLTVSVASCKRRAWCMKLCSWHKSPAE